MENLLVTRLTPTANVPTRNITDEDENPDAGCDLYSDEDKIIPAWGRSTVGTGISVAIPKGCYGRIASRSGLSCKENIDVGAGVIDRGYRGELKVCIINSCGEPFHVKMGMKIAQLICEKVAYPKIVCVDNLDETSRGCKGFGSSGV